jgi:hypothetical protein
MREFSGPYRDNALYQGTALAVPLSPNQELGFSPWAFSLPGQGVAGAEAQFSFIPLRLD